jgi:large repetitive protein
MQYDGEGEACVDSSTCGPGLVCRVKLGGTMKTCEKHVCEDGVDDDGDGKNDYPDDPGCTSPTDDDESDTCPSGATCPACANGLDDDGDGQTDYPNDTSCPSASGASEACSGEHDAIGQITSGTTTGTLVGAHDDHAPSCGSSGGADVLYTMRITATSALQIDTNGSAITDTILSLLGATCSEPAVACDDDGGDGSLSLIALQNQPAGVYVVAVDAFNGSTPLAPFTLNVHGTIAVGASCEPDVSLNGALACPADQPCTGAVGSRICHQPECADGIDNNGDGKIDFPNDPGCTSATDDSESNVCPGPMCPACGDGIDNDSDGLTDYPADFACASASGATEAFCSADMDFGGLVTMPTTMSTLAGLHSDLTESCQAMTGNDQTFALKLPVPVASLQIDTDNSTIFDTVLAVRDAQCTTELSCDDDSGFGTLSLITLTNVQPGIYAITVDAYGTTNNNGPFHLNVLGTVAPGTACTDALFTTGVLVCPTGMSCTAGTCQ